MRNLVRAPATILGVFGVLSTLASAGTAKADGDLIVTGFAGAMTDAVWEEAIQIWDVEYLDSGLVGLAVGQDVLQRGRLHFGYEIQLVRHFGLQDHFEINAPLVVRYDRTGHRLPQVSSLAFGLGLSWASEKPRVEVEDDGDTTRTLFYWMGEIGVDLPGTETEGVLRLHHRSDGFGAFPVDSGSNAITVGLRRRF